MRYLIIFRDGSTRKVSQKVGEQVVDLLASGKHVVVDGEFFNSSYISKVLKIDARNFDRDYAEQQQLAEQRENDKLDTPKQLGEG